jgi:hypothetical protein
VAFGASLVGKPLHADTLAGCQAELEGAFLLAFRLVELLGRREAGLADDAEARLLRVLTPITKLTTGRQAVSVASEVLELHGGAGYVEDTGLPRLLRDAQVLPIWEGTTNVLALDTLRALTADGAQAALADELERHLAAVRDSSLTPCVEAARAALTHAGQLAAAGESSARRFALTLGRALEVALVAAHAEWCLAHGHGGRAAAAARRLAAGLDLVGAAPAADDTRLLVQ